MAIQDTWFGAWLRNINMPAEDAFAITPHATNDLPQVTRAITAKVAGDVNVQTFKGNTVSIYVAAGAIFPIRVKKVFVSGTTATGIVGLV